MGENILETNRKRSVPARLSICKSILFYFADTGFLDGEALLNTQEEHTIHTSSSTEVLRVNATVTKSMTGEL